ncbi:MAG: nucleoside hydrolase [Roseiflexaceae bacterium]
MRVWIDTDCGCDDAAALAYLLYHPAIEIIGISTTFGNTSADNVTRNVLTLLELAGRHSIPVARGAEEPLVVTRSRTGKFVHGPDGLWMHQRPHALEGLPQAQDALAAALRTYDDLTVLALGPLTTIAQVSPYYSGTRLIILAGAVHGGNRTPVAEFNAYADPHALARTLADTWVITLLPLDAFAKFQVDAEFPSHLIQSADPLRHTLGHILRDYRAALTQSDTPSELPDVVAAVYLTDPTIGATTPALVQVVLDGPARGQTIVATTLEHKILILASDDELSALADRAQKPGFDLTKELDVILQRVPTLVHLVTQLDAQAVDTHFARILL